jgi:hypothetical protein
MSFQVVDQLAIYLSLGCLLDRVTWSSVY